MAESERSLVQWLAWMEANHPRQIELGLDRIAAVAQRMDWACAYAPRPLAAGSERAQPQRPRVVTVAGTNGKGSCVALLEAMLLADGYRVGAYSSPHLLQYNERVRIDGVAIDDAALCGAFQAVYDALGDISLTYFEFGTLAALWLFAKQRLDVWVLEVGLGGRLDAVNLVDADVAIITSIDLDHQDWLGDTRDAIGREKAGIFRSGRPAICADPQPPGSMIETARKSGVQWLPVGTAYGYEATPDDWHWSGPLLPGAPDLQHLPLPSLPLPSAAAAVASRYLLGLERPPSVSAIRAAMAGASLPGRFQRMQLDAVEVVLDVGHNPLAARWLATQLMARPATTRAVFAIMSDKDRDGVIAPLRDVVARWYVGDLPDNSRAAPARMVAASLEQHGATVEHMATLLEAWQAALRDARPGDRILVFGSFFTVAAVQSALASKLAAEKD